jgi:hypothetical protein
MGFHLVERIAGSEARAGIAKQVDSPFWCEVFSVIDRF